jgi:hypothetical protein
MDCFMRLSWTIALLLVLPGGLYAVESPIGLSGHKVSANRADLFWFYPGINAATLAYDDGSSEAPVAVSENDRDNRIAVTFTQFTAPVYIRGGYAYILNLDPNPSDPGSPLSPIELSLHQDDDGKPGQMISGPVTVQASGIWSGAGEWIYAEFDYLHENDHPLWLQVRWPSSNPFMPKLGGDNGSVDFMSMYGYLNAGENIWDDFTDYDIMLRLDVLNNTRDVPPDPGEAVIDSFRIYARDRLPVYPDDGYYASSTAGDRLHRRVILGAINNHFCVTAWEGSLEGEASGSVFIEGSSGHVPPVTIVPEEMELAVSPGENITAFMAIRNRGSELLSYEYMPASPAPGGALGIPMTIIGGAGEIAPGQTDSIEFRINSSTLQIGDYYEFGMIEFEDSSEVYLPRNVSIHLSVDVGTIAEDIGEALPRQPILHQNFPNPFNSETTIAVERDGIRGVVSLRIIDMLGRLVTELLPVNASQNILIFDWNGTDSEGAHCPSGIYLYSVSDGTGNWKKMLLIR